MYEVWGSTGDHGGHKKFEDLNEAVKFAQEFDRAEIRDHNDRIVQRFQ